MHLSPKGGFVIPSYNHSYSSWAQVQVYDDVFKFQPTFSSSSLTNFSSLSSTNRRAHRCQYRAGTYHRLSARVKELADELCGGRCVFLLEGGYDLQGLSEGVTDSFRALLGVRVFFSPSLSFLPLFFFFFFGSPPIPPKRMKRNYSSARCSYEYLLRP